MHRVGPAARARAGALGQASGAPKQREQTAGAGRNSGASAEAAGARQGGLFLLCRIQLPLEVGDGVVQLLLQLGHLPLLSPLQLGVLELQVLHLALPLHLLPLQGVLEDVPLLLCVPEPRGELLLDLARVAVVQLPLHALGLLAQEPKLRRRLLAPPLRRLQLLPHVLQSVAGDALRLDSEEQLVLQGLDVCVVLLRGLCGVLAASLGLGLGGRRHSGTFLLLRRLGHGVARDSHHLGETLHLALQLRLPARQVLLELGLLEAGLRELPLELLDSGEVLLLVGAALVALRRARRRWRRLAENDLAVLVHRLAVEVVQVADLSGVGPTEGAAGRGAAVDAHLVLLLDTGQLAPRVPRRHLPHAGPTPPARLSSSSLTRAPEVLVQQLLLRLPQLPLHVADPGLAAILHTQHLQPQLAKLVGQPALLLPRRHDHGLQLSQLAPLLCRDAAIEVVLVVLSKPGSCVGQRLGGIELRLPCLQSRFDIGELVLVALLLLIQLLGELLPDRFDPLRLPGLEALHAIVRLVQRLRPLGANALTVL
mmetsp:Transcript_106809/g.308957  ORF Transcript_106809/g.308957 Transcript_106809/m.308957 type:complete len:538 (+) Transcript_106809:650-2263(+)